MPLDLTICDPDRPDINWLYQHATLQRLFRPVADGRSQFFSQVPGLVNFHSRASLTNDQYPNLDLLLQHYLLEFTQGYVNLLGGTENFGWALHPFSVVEVTTPLSDWFPLYWSLLGDYLKIDLDSVIPAGDDRRIMLSGHSLGGAASVYFAYRDAARPVRRDRAVVSFGCPLTRGKVGMDDADFPHIRVIRDGDSVPSMPQNFISVPLALLYLKARAVGLYHYGAAVRLTLDNEYSLVDHHWTRYSAIGFVLHLIGATTENWNPFRAHYMTSYCCHLRRVLAREGIRPDAFWDQVNDFLNAKEGEVWAIPGFPVPSLPPGDWGPVATPTTDQVAALDADEQIDQVLTASFTARASAVPILRNQSLAAFLSSRSQRDFRDVVIRLYQVPLADPTTAVLADFVEADYLGYSPVGGDEWQTFAPNNFTAAKRYFRRATFHDYSAFEPNNICGWYATALEGPARVPVLIAWEQFGSPVAFNTPERGIHLELELTAA